MGRLKVCGCGEAKILHSHCVRIGPPTMSVMTGLNLILIKLPISSKCKNFRCRRKLRRKKGFQRKMLQVNYVLVFICCCHFPSLKNLFKHLNKNKVITLYLTSQSKFCVLEVIYIQNQVVG